LQITYIHRKKRRSRSAFC